MTSYIYQKYRTPIENQRQWPADLACQPLYHDFYKKFDSAYFAYRLIGLVGRVFTNGPVDLGSVPSCVIPKTLKIVLDISLFNTQQYKVHIKGKVEQFRERSSALPYTSV